MPKEVNDPADHILPLYINGLSGRMLRLPAKGRKRRELLIIYGHHSSIERMYGIADYLNQFGAVTMPDLPGFGGMEAFYKIGEKPTIDKLADYLAAFVKLRYRNRRFSIFGLSLGFVIVTRMLQRYPELAKRVDLVVSVVGFAHKDDFVFKKRNYLLMRYSASFFSNRLPSAVAKHLVLNGPVIRKLYDVGEKIAFNDKVATLKEKDREERINFEIILWQSNDLRTYMETAVSMLLLVPPKIHIDLDVHHVAIDNDRYFDNIRVEQHMREIYKDFTMYKGKLDNHAPSVIASAQEVGSLIPPALRKLLRQKV